MKILITGSAGFIGSNLLERYAPDNQVIGLDNLSRNGTEDNLMYLREKYIFDFRKVDITTFDFSYLPEVDVIFHMAAQVGVQKSIADPINDFKQNILGTLNVLEYARRHEKKPIVIFASTNKVYGDIQVNKPIDENQPLNFHTPYGVSKGSSEQYVLDYCRIYGVPAVVFRQSCIYGKHQLGAEEQGWISHFINSNYQKQPLTIYGDGDQVRDCLWVTDLIDAYEAAVENIEKVKGQVYNIGGGKDNTLSLNELVKKANITTNITFSDWRPADQKYFVCDITKASKELKWSPKVSVDEGLTLMQQDVEARWQR